MKIQLWLDTYYPKEERNKIEKLYIESNKYEGHLDLTDFVNLKTLRSWNNPEITSIDLSKCINLTFLDIFENNKITNLDLNNNRELTNVKIVNNEALSADLNMFSHLNKLEKLDIGGYVKWDNKSNFHGSLKSLENCKDLEYLNIKWNKNITEGAECLPNKILENSKFRWEGTGFQKEIEPFDNDIKIWAMVQQKQKVFTNPTIASSTSSDVVGEERTEEIETDVIQSAKTLDKSTQTDLISQQIELLIAQIETNNENTISCQQS